MKETPYEMADRIAAAARTLCCNDQRDYGLAMAGILRREADAGGKRQRTVDLIKKEPSSD